MRHRCNIARAALVLALAALSAACGGPDVVSGDTDEVAPPFGKSDGTDVADTDCRVVLRSVAHKTAGAFSGVLWVTFTGRFDVAEALLKDPAASVHLMFKAGSESRWEIEDAQPTSGGPKGFKRFSFRLDAATLTPHDVEFERDTLELLPFVDTPAGRILDHNVVGAQGADRYVIAAPDYRYSAGSGVCQAPMRAATTEAAPRVAPGEVTVRVGQPSSNPCKTAGPYATALTVHDYQTTDAQAAAHVCVRVPSTATVASDAFDVRVHYRFDRDGKFIQSSIPFDRVVGTKGQYALDLWTLDPYPASGCPETSIDLEYKTDDFNMWARAELYVTIGGDEKPAELRPGPAAYFEALYGAFPAFECLH